MAVCQHGDMTAWWFIRVVVSLGQHSVGSACQCSCVSVPTCKHAGVPMYRCVVMSVCQLCRHVLGYQCVGVLVCDCFAVSVCQYVVVLVCHCAGMSV